MPNFNSISELQAYIKKQAKIALKTQVGTRVQELLREYIKQEVYDSYEPTLYQRTYALLNCLEVGEVIEAGNVLTISIYFPLEKLGHFSIAGGSDYNYAATENINVSHLAEWLENGYYVWGGRPKTYFIEETMKDLRANLYHVNEFIKYLSSQGINVK